MLGALPALSCQVWKCMISDPPILSSIRRTSRLLALCANAGYRLLPPCSMNAKLKAGGARNRLEVIRNAPVRI